MAMKCLRVTLGSTWGQKFFRLSLFDSPTALLAINFLIVTIYFNFFSLHVLYVCIIYLYYTFLYIHAIHVCVYIIYMYYYMYDFFYASHVSHLIYVDEIYCCILLIHL